ncbi:MAG: chemotaxis-specific protein-glutamate methyltransferase CheB [Deltaproteobacteria bacterium]|nr:chemotaxis-specific protein-glutamate methyltransferase CheB [Deltaproteobacteria bacterium]
MSKVVRILVVDDSPLFVEALTMVLEEDPELTVVGFAGDGVAALRMVEKLEPDLITMDIQMPQMDGLTAVEKIMSSRPTPILMLTGDPARTGKKWHFDALKRGALDLQVKPRLITEIGADQATVEAEAEALRAHIKLLASVPVVYRRQRTGTITGTHRARSAQPSSTPRLGAVGIVSSTGGPPVLAEILEGLPADFPLPILVVQHLAAGFAPHLVDWLRSATQLKVEMAAEGAHPEPGKVYVAPSGRHLVLDGRGNLHLDGNTPPFHGHRPAGTILLESMARQCGAAAVGLVLTGMGVDGARGLAAIGERGGATLAQDEQSSAVYGMPRAAAEEGKASLIVPRHELARTLLEVSRRRVG